MMRVWVNETECGDFRGMGGYWNDRDNRDDECDEERCGGSQLLSREAVAAGAGEGCRCRWAVCVCREVDEGLLQTQLCESAAFAEECDVLPYTGAGRGGWISCVQAV